jgi:hypothetical protein
MREIDAKQSVSWHEGKAGKDLKFTRIGIDVAGRKIEAIMKKLAVK